MKLKLMLCVIIHALQDLMGFFGERGKSHELWMLMFLQLNQRKLFYLFKDCNRAL